jgi:pantetheine-phosphate adenylyltransferase
VNKANKHVLESLTHRIDRVRSFLTLFKPSLEYEIVPIHDVYGPPDPEIQALVVSKETLSGAAASRFISSSLPFIYSDSKCA